MIPYRKKSRSHLTSAEDQAAKGSSLASMYSSTTEAYVAYIARKRAVVVATFVLLVLVAVLSASIGASDMSFTELIAAVFGFGNSQDMIVVWNLRMPRVLTAMIGGLALAVAGCAFQATLRNPLASASTLGVAQGAAMGASIAIILMGGSAGTAASAGTISTNPYITALLAYIGAMTSTLVILGLFKLRDMSPEAIVLAGVALSALFTGITTIIQYFADDSQVAAVVFWTFGDLGRANYQQIAIMGVVTLLCVIYFFFNRWNLNAVETGEVSAQGLGVNVRLQRAIGMLLASASASCVIAFCGTINFVGLVAPHIMRRLVGSDYRFLLPASAFAGAVLLLLGDIVARVAIPPLILPISAITSFIGAPMFVYLLFKGVRR